MERGIIAYHRDEDGDWVAELACGHDQHVRHRPPFQLRDWILTSEGRESRLRTTLDCPLCDRAELPGTARWVRTTAVWDERTVPAALRRTHRLAEGNWGRIVVHDGRLRFVAVTVPAIDVGLEAGSTQAIPPEIDHRVEPIGAVRVSIDFFVVDRTGGVTETRAESAQEGGDPACWAGLLCPECGAVVDGTEHHRPGCPVGGPAS
ncbi:MAG TPA: DUF3565 domain-containing protein [Acidimicrobiales bacterium]|nr:DUF3565 domain-containing protein [Acidimicrobiales bacterium]